MSEMLPSEEMMNGKQENQESEINEDHPLLGYGFMGLISDTINKFTTRRILMQLMRT